MKKGAARLFCFVGSLLLLAATVSIGGSLAAHYKALSEASRQADIDQASAAANGVVTIPGGSSDLNFDGSTQLFLLLCGVGFLGAGLALWPKAPQLEAPDDLNEVGE